MDSSSDSYQRYESNYDHNSRKMRRYKCCYIRCGCSGCCCIATWVVLSIILITIAVIIVLYIQSGIQIDVAFLDRAKFKDWMDGLMVDEAEYADDRDWWPEGGMDSDSEEDSDSESEDSD